MSEPDLYLSKAAEAEKHAARARSRDAKRLLTQIAESWRLLAWYAGTTKDGLQPR
jgi:hypothetical protein